MREFVTITIAVILIWILIELVKRLINQRLNNFGRIIAIVVKAFLAILFATFFLVLNFFITWHLSDIEVALVIVLTADVFLDLIKGVIRLIAYVAKKEYHEVPFVWTVFSATLTVAYLAYGLFNMYDIRRVDTFYTSNLINDEHHIAYMADMHVENEYVLNRLDALVDEINLANPEIVILGGDIIDEYTTKEVMLSTCEKLGRLSADVYFIYGNHDRQIDGRFLGGQRFSCEEYEAAMRDNNIRAVKDEYIDLGDFVILGRDDLTSETRKQLSEMTNSAPDKFLILLDHQPTETDDLVASGAQLQISGHTHGGQIFPMGILSEFIGIHAVGTFEYGDALLYISSGEHGWRVPFRTERHSVYEMISLIPEK